MPWAELPAADKSLTEICHIITDVARTSEGYYPRNYTMGYDKAKRLPSTAVTPRASRANGTGAMIPRWRRASR